MTLQIATWWLVIQAFGLAGLPLARFLFRALPDKGYAFAKALGLLLIGYLAWLIAMLGLAPFGRGLLVVSGIVVAGIGLLVARPPYGRSIERPDDRDGKTRGKRQETREGKERVPGLLAPGSWLLAPVSGGWLRENWKLVLGYEALFLVALVFVALLRSYNPHPWGTERPMDFALFNAIRTSASFPPHDPWLAGYSINYYYFGYMLMASVALISGLEPSVAFNLSLALVFALTALGVAGVIFNLIVLTKPDEGRRTKDEGPMYGDPSVAALDEAQGVRSDVPSSSFFIRLVAIPLAVVLVLLAGNQAGALEIVTGVEISVALKGQQLSQAISNGLGPRQPLYLDPPFKANGWDFDAVNVATPKDMWADFNWWWPSRVVWDDYADPESPGAQPFRRYTITEFPFFSFWLGDMHPHVMSLPFVLLALALALQTSARPAAPAFMMGRRGWLELSLTGIVLGSLYAINSWDFPTYLLLFLGALLILHVRLGNPLVPTTDDRRPTTEEAAATLVASPSVAAEPESPATLHGGPSVAASPAVAATPESPATLHGGPSVAAMSESDETPSVAATSESPATLYGGPSVAATSESQELGDVDRPGTTDDSPAHPLTPSPAHPLTRVWWRLYLNQAMLAMLASFAMLAPFYLTFRSLVGGKDPLVNLPVLDFLTRTLGFVTSSRTTLFSFLLIFGLFLLPLLAYLVAQRANTRFAPTPAQGEHEVRPYTRSGCMLYAPTAVLAALAIGLLIGFPLLALLPLAIYAVDLAIRRAQQPAAAFVLWGFALVCLVCFGTELVYIRDGFEGSSSRMNTIFKFYYQAWLLWGVLAGYALWWLAARMTTDDRRPTTDDRMPDTRQAIAMVRRSSILDPRSSILIRWLLTGIFSVLFVALLAGALIYPWLTAGKTFREAQRIGLEGQTPQESTPEGAAAIDWLRANAPGNAVVLEAVGGSYSSEGFGGVSAATGLATVLGWPGHEDQWRGGDPAVRAQIGPRQQDVAAIYTTTDLGQARELLAKYKVGYIYVGSLERSVITQAGAPPAALDKFAQLGELVFQQGDITIYQVNT